MAYSPILCAALENGVLSSSSMGKVSEDLEETACERYNLLSSQRHLWEAGH